MQARTALSTLAAGALVLGTALPGTAGGGPSTEVVTSDVIAPFNLAVDGRNVYVADGFALQVSKLRHGGLVPVANPTTAEDVAGIDVNDYGRIAWTETNFTAATATLEVRGPKGYSLSADLRRLEDVRNPDKRVEYGINGPGPCVRAAFDAIGQPAEYTGLVDAHPYAVTAWKDGSWIVADAGGNDLLEVDRRGRVSLLAVLPPQPLTFTADQAAALGLPSCVVGKTFRFEPVPTDVEVGPDGTLYVSTLPGGPEDPSLGARGAVYTVNPSTGKATRMASGFLGATNLAVAKDGTVYVTELFAGQVSRIRHGKVTPFVPIANALSVEVDRGGLWVGTLAPLGEMGPEGPGTVVRVTW